MIVTLIGFSGAGKSYWSGRLSRERDFRVISCDDLIEEKLAAEGVNFKGFGIQAVAEWMGQPFEQGFNERQNKYLAHEVDVMREIIAEFVDSDQLSNVVIDTSGSVIYTGDQILSELKKFSTLVYLETTRQQYDLMLQRYISHPKPVIWGDMFKKGAMENEQEALARCFAELLRYRAKKYEESADVTLRFDEHAERMLSCDDFLALIAKR